jgi:hypothetical protein
VVVVLVPVRRFLDGQIVGLRAGIQGGLRGQNSLQAVLFGRNGIELPAQPDVQRQIGSDAPVVLAEEALLVIAEVAHARSAGGLKGIQVAVEGLCHR